MYLLFNCILLPYNKIYPFVTLSSLLYHVCSPHSILRIQHILNIFFSLFLSLFSLVSNWGSQVSLVQQGNCFYYSIILLTYHPAVESIPKKSVRVWCSPLAQLLQSNCPSLTNMGKQIPHGYTYFHRSQNNCSNTYTLVSSHL